MAGRSLASSVPHYSGGTAPDSHRVPDCLAVLIECLISIPGSLCQDPKPGRVTSGPGRTRRLNRHQLCGAAEPNHENVHAPVYPPHQCLFKEGGEPDPCGFPAFHVLQFPENPQEPESDPGDASGSDRSRVEFGGNCCAYRINSLLTMCIFPLDFAQGENYTDLITRSYDLLMSSYDLYMRSTRC